MVAAVVVTTLPADNTDVSTCDDADASIVSGMTVKVASPLEPR